MTPANGPTPRETSLANTLRTTVPSLSFPLLDAGTWCRPGGRAERCFTIGKVNTALFLGGDMAVVGTPVLICWAEIVASDFIRDCSGGHCASIGVRVNVRHTGSAAVGERVKVGVKVVSAVFQMVRFAVTIAVETTGAVLLEGEHDRAIVDRPV